MEARSGALHILEISLMMTSWGSKHAAEWIITYKVVFGWSVCWLFIYIPT